MFRKVFPILKAVLGIILLAVTLWRLDWKAVEAGFRAVRIGWVGAGLACVLLTLAIKYLRWVLLLRVKGQPVRWGRLAEAYFIGQAANILLPFRGGEIVRFSWAATGATTYSGILAASIFLEKYLDLSGLTVLTAYLILDQPGLAPFNHPYRLALLAGCGALVISILWLAPLLWERGKNRFLNWKWLKRLHLETEIDQLMTYCRTIRSAGRLLLLLGITMLAWLIMILTNLAVMEAAGIPLSLDAAGAVVVLVYIGGIPALMPGNMGPFYFFASLGLTLYGIKPEPALTFAVVLHVLVTLPSLLAAGSSLLFQSPRALDQAAP